MRSPRYLPQLDVLRGIAVLMVMFYHSGRNVPSLHLDSVFHYGWAGVDLFFVLSGFLITGILLRTKETSGYLLNFYARRILRIWPLYFCLLAFGFLAMPILYPQLRPSVAEQCYPWQAYFFFIQNLIVPASGHFGPLQITWSLCVEEQFYLVWPFVILFCSTKAVRRIAISAIFASLALRIAAHNGLAIDAYHNTLSHLDGLALGSLTALIVPQLEAAVIWKRSLLLGGLALVAIAATAPFGVARWSLITLLSAFFCGLMGLSIVWARFPKGGFLAFTGRISYGLYLLHAPAFDVVRGAHIRELIARSSSFVVNDIAILACSMALAYGLAFTSWKLLESPMLALKKNFEPRTHAKHDGDNRLATATASS